MKVYIVGGGQSNFLPFFPMGATLTENIGAADVVLFTGGPDVSPELYNETYHPSTVCSTGRDLYDMNKWNVVADHPVLKVGICRGAQFLCVMNGGTLWQHVDNHQRWHNITTEEDCFRVSSTHHQMMREVGDGKILAYSRETTIKQDDSSNFVQGDANHDLGDIFLDPEVVHWEDTNSLSVQYHPEYMDANSAGVEYFQQLVRKYLN